MVDCALYKMQYDVENSKLLTVTAIMFVIKIESDYTKNLPAFIGAFSHHFRFSLNDVMKTESIMFELMPDSLSTMLLFTEIVEAMVSFHDIPWLAQPAAKKAVAEQCLFEYTQGSNWQSIFGVCVGPLLASANSDPDREVLWRESLKLFKSLEIDTNFAGEQDPREIEGVDTRMQEE